MIQLFSNWDGGVVCRWEVVGVWIEDFSGGLGNHGLNGGGYKHYDGW